VAQLEDNLGAVGWSLDGAQVQRLTEASEKRLPYPYALLRDLKQV
jgi:aryl-alcohol dehydrogenase-like predicted oxidoreductase